MKVTIVQESLRDYRVPFFEMLRTVLAQDGIELQLLVGEPDEGERSKADSALIPWAKTVPTHRLRAAGRSLVWQPCLGPIGGSDLVIVEQASRQLLNYILLAWRALGGPNVAYWGHGRNLAIGSSSAAGEWLKLRTSTRARWWFAYNDFSARIVSDMGFPPSRITSVMNTVVSFQSSTEDVASSDQRAIQVLAAAGVTSDNVGVFIGSLYSNKRLDFLLAAAEQVRQQVPDFQLLVVGAGPDTAIVEAASRLHDWVVFAGRKTGQELSVLARSAKVLLVPSFVGLVAIDSFALGIPIVTLKRAEHPPEFDYLVHGENACLVDAAADGEGVTHYATAIVSLLRDPETLARLREGCMKSSRVYTMENMVSRFAEGIRRAIAT